MLRLINDHFFKIAITALALAIILSFTSLSSWKSMDEVFIFFPEDEHIFFREAKTNLDLLSKKDNDEYILQWSFASETNEPAFLRSDLSIMFENGAFAAAKKQSLKDQLFIEGVESYDGEDSGRFDVITFHHAETHYEEDIYRSKHAWSQDQLYVVDSPFSQLHAFKEPSSDDESRSKQVLDSIIDQQLSYELDELVEEFQIDVDEYHLFTLLDLPQYMHLPLPGMTEKESFATVGQLWEGFYRYYVLGINTFTEETYSPRGNSIPHILLHKDGTHLLLLYKTKDGSKQQLFQMINKDEDMTYQDSIN
ncbi:hypothetical protein CR194_01875 [Salipaludibacillus keqinensis]|uniref:Uncharacterized protein n=1 Tax=Salipaludibacillus keqinensis TaxID=2045207 RepID=A0A323TJQ1_9BACI|nr:hypothetical protein [Salipaludibacillus keqinensis]PYZ94306.1 hypothetical protein CR194_01875 [Salipaludibacillus keqinensis]